MKKILLLAILLVLGYEMPVLGQYCSGCEIPSNVRAKRIAAADRALERAKDREEEILGRHFPFGIPLAPPDAGNEFMLMLFEWVTWYDGDLKAPLWVTYEFSRSSARRKRVPRQDCFRLDTRLLESDASFCEDYRGSGHDRGHIVPANDSKRNQTMMDNSFLFSNMAAQLPNFNQRVWMRLESKTNSWVAGTGVNIVSGAVYDRDNDGRRDSDAQAERIRPRNRVAIASHFYKIVLHKRPNGVIDTISFLLQHNNRIDTNNDEYLGNVITSIDEIERLTGINFFPDMPSEQQARVEAGKASFLGKWFTH